MQWNWQTKSNHMVFVLKANLVSKTWNSASYGPCKDSTNSHSSLETMNHLFKSNCHILSLSLVVVHQLSFSICCCSCRTPVLPLAQWAFSTLPPGPPSVLHLPLLSPLFPVVPPHLVPLPTALLFPFNPVLLPAHSHVLSSFIRWFLMSCRDWAQVIFRSFEAVHPLQINASKTESWEYSYRRF